MAPSLVELVLVGLPKRLVEVFLRDASLSCHCRHQERAERSFRTVNRDLEEHVSGPLHPLLVRAFGVAVGEA